MVTGMVFYQLTFCPRCWNRGVSHTCFTFLPSSVLVFNELWKLGKSARFIHPCCFPADNVGIFRKWKFQAWCWLAPLSLSLTATLIDLHFCLLWHEPSCLCISLFPPSVCTGEHRTGGRCDNPLCYVWAHFILLHKCLDLRSPLHDGSYIPGSAEHSTRAHSHCRGQIRAQGTDFSLIRS